MHGRQNMVDKYWTLENKYWTSTKNNPITLYFSRYSINNCLTSPLYGADREIANQFLLIYRAARFQWQFQAWSRSSAQRSGSVQWNPSDSARTWTLWTPYLGDWNLRCIMRLIIPYVLPAERLIIGVVKLGVSGVNYFSAVGHKMFVGDRV